jgi:hypothetical protein
MELKESNSSKHFKISVFKSGIRMLGCASLCKSDIWAAGLLLIVAEILGIIEEL